MNDNKSNVYYFEAKTMKELYSSISDWQLENKKRLQSVNVQKDNDSFCCIALSNPTEVVIVNQDGSEFADVMNGKGLRVYTEEIVETREAY